MILAIDHIAYGIGPGDAYAGQLEAVGYKSVFQERNVPNPQAKRTVVRQYSPTHTIAFYKKKGELNVELVDHGHASPVSSPWISFDPAQEPRTIRVRSSVPEKSKQFWAALGFRDGKFFSPLTGDIRLQIEPDEKMSLALADDAGFNCIGFIAGALDADRVRLMETGFTATDISNITLNGRSMRIAFVRGPSGELVELIGMQK